MAQTCCRRCGHAGPRFDARDYNLEKLAERIRTGGPIKTVRVSSAQASGYAKEFSYWGAALYELRIGAAGQVINTCVRRASSDRRSVAGAKRDAEATGRLLFQGIGQVTESQAGEILRALEARA